MRLALMQAQKNIGNTGKNPSVGCVVVKDNCVISAACTSVGGRPHAEQNAIKLSKINFRDSDMYVTIEPCSHFGKTPPCVRLIVKNNIKRVFFSLYDPDIRTYKKSMNQLKKNNILVKNGILSSKIKYFYKSYLKFKSNDLPFVTVKLAVSRDFFTISKKKKWITNNFSRGRGHILRSQHDCIITSSRTIINDNPRLSCRIKGLEDTSPTRIIIDKKLKIPIKSNIIKSSKRVSTIIFYTTGNKKKIAYLKKNKVNLIKTPLDNNTNFDLSNILKKLKLLGFSRILLESGINLITNFLSKNLVDEFQLFVSNKDLKKKGLNSFKKNYSIYLKKKKCNNTDVNLFGDTLFSYRIK